MAAKSAMASLELNIANPMQMFNSMDPAPFHERDLDVDVVDYIIDWAQEVAPDAQLNLVVTVYHEAPPRIVNIKGLLRVDFLTEAVKWTC